MSGRSKNKRTSRKNKPILSEEDKKQIEDEVEFDEEEEEEYDPEDVYEDDEEEEEEEKVDVSKLSPRQLAAYDSNNRKILFLKALAIDVYQDTLKLARKCGLQGQSMPLQVVSMIMGLISETKDDIDYPERILKYLNGLVPDGYPNKVKLDASDVNELTNLFKVFEEKLQSTAKITDPDKIFGEGTITDTKTINPPNTKKENIVMMDANQQPIDPTNVGSRIPIENGEIYPTPETQKDINFYAGRYGMPDVGLMEMALRRIPNPRPNSINAFITSFSDLYTDWMQNPMKMLEELKFFFGPTHGEHAYRLWKDYRERYMKQQGYSPIPQSGGMTGEYSPFNFPNQMQQMGTSGMMQPMGISPEMEAERMAERRMNKMMQMIQLRMMEKAMENQTPTPVMGQNYEEILDQNGKVIKRIFMSNGHAGANANPMEQISPYITIFQELIRGANNEKVELLRKISTPDTTWQDLAKTMVSTHLNQQNPIEVAKNYMEVANMFQQKNASQNDGVSKNIEAVKLDVDSKIAMQELELRKLEMQHNWRMDEKQVAEQDNNVDKWLNVMLQMGEGIIKPVAMKFVEGLGGANKMPNNPLAMFGNQQQQIPQPPPAYQQAQAMQEQQFYQQQQPRPQQQPIPPIQPIPPMNQQRAYNQPQPQNFRQPMQKPISQISDQQLQQELSSLSPDQIQELEDKMALDDVNREKVRNALRAHKNARRFNKSPQPTAQQMEAQQVLFNPPSQDVLEELDELDEELEEQDLLDEDGAEREVPIAKGIDKTVANNVEGQKIKSFKEFAPVTSSDMKSRKKMTKQQEAMYATGQMSDRELARLQDVTVDEDDEYSSDGVPLPAGIRNESEDKMVEENLKQTKQTPTRKSSPRKKKEEKSPEQEYTEEKDQADKIVAEAEDILSEVEEIPSDDNE